MCTRSPAAYAGPGVVRVGAFLGSLRDLELVPVNGVDHPTSGRSAEALAAGIPQTAWGAYADRWAANKKE